MSAQKRCFCRNDREWNDFVLGLKAFACPHCGRVGDLIRHGACRGFDDRTPANKTLRARRIFCSNRNLRQGCGKTFSVWVAQVVRRLSITTRRLWGLLRYAVADGLAAAIRRVRDAGCSLSDRSLLRHWRRFRLAQSALRTALSGLRPPPQPPPDGSPEAHVLAHLQAAFPDCDCPIAEFQYATRTFFM